MNRFISNAKLIKEINYDRSRNYNLLKILYYELGIKQIIEFESGPK